MEKGDANGMADDERREAAEALFDAIKKQDSVEVARLLAAGANPDTWGFTDANGDRPLQAAARRGGKAEAEVVGLLLDAGADIDFQGDYHATALHRAVYDDIGDGWTTARLLIRRGARVGPDLYDRDGCTAPDAAMLQGNDGAVLAMLDEGLDPKTMGLSGPMIWYAAWDSPNVVERLLAVGVSADSPSEHGTPLMRAAEAVANLSEVKEDDLEYICFRLLLDAGANPEARNEDGFDSWDLLGGNAGQVKALLEARRLDSPDVKPGTPPDEPRQRGL